MINPDIPAQPWNDPTDLEIIIPEGTLLNASYPAATTFGNHLCPPNADAIIRALADGHPRIASPQDGTNSCVPSPQAGINAPCRNDTYVDILFMGLKGGAGATDGLRWLRSYRHDRRLGRHPRSGL